MYLTFIMTDHSNKDGQLNMMIAWDEQLSVKSNTDYFIIFFSNNVISSNLSGSTRLSSYFLVVVNSLYVALLLLLFLCEKICKRDREKKNKKTKRKLCALTFSLVSKQHNAYCIHIQRYKTIENDDDKKKKNPK